MGARVVCVGMGFIGAEVAASLRTVGWRFTVVEIFGPPCTDPRPEIGVFSKGSIATTG